jgi:hypothetical protein
LCHMSIQNFHFIFIFPTLYIIPHAISCIHTIFRMIFALNLKHTFSFYLLILLLILLMLSSFILEWNDILENYHLIAFWIRKSRFTFFCWFRSRNEGFHTFQYPYLISSIS